MTAAAGGAERDGVRHLHALAQHPRASGSIEEARACAYSASVLRDAGFTVREETFEYSRFPGAYGTPVVGALLTAAVVSASILGLAQENAVRIATPLVADLLVAFLAARAMLGDGVLRMRWMRSRGINLVAVRGNATPRVWLVAHLDSKSQPVPSLVRMTGIVTLLASVLVAIAALLLTLAGVPARMEWWVALVAALAGGLPVMASVVGNASPGALDNASGVAAVLVAASRVNPKLAIGVLLPSAEELGLAGARAWARTNDPAIALNCDGVDDNGALVMMHSRSADQGVVAAIRRAAPQAQLRRMPLGLLTDSVALADKGWRTLTLSHGSLRTLRRVHTTADSLDNLQGLNIDDVGAVLARAAEELSQ